jgi:hypothetical protein
VFGGRGKGGSPDGKIYSPIEASDVPLCTSVSQDQTPKIDTYYQTLEGISQMRGRLTRTGFCPFYEQAVPDPASGLLAGSAGKWRGDDTLPARAVLA